jgi:hypothetical protein
MYYMYVGVWNTVRTYCYSQRLEKVPLSKAVCNLVIHSAEGRLKEEFVDESTERVRSFRLFLFKSIATIVPILSPKRTSTT